MYTYRGGVARQGPGQRIPAKGLLQGKVPGTFPITPATSDTWPALRPPGVFEFTTANNLPQANSGQGQATGLNTPLSGRKECYSSLPSKHEHTEMPPRGVGRGVPEGFRVPPIPATPGRTQPTPSASRSLGAELTGEFTSMLGT